MTIKQNKKCGQGHEDAGKVKRYFELTTVIFVGTFQGLEDFLKMG